MLNISLPASMAELKRSQMERALTTTNSTVPLESVMDFLKVIRHHYNKSLVPLQCNTPNKSYPLHVAAAIGDIATIKQLLKSGSSIEQRDDLHLTPLQVASVSGQAETVSFLISKGANVFAMDGYKFNLTALDLAVMESRAEVVNVLITDGHVLDKADVFEMANIYDMAFGMVWALASYCEEAKSINHFDAALETFVAIVNTQDLALLEFPVTEKKDKKSVQEIIGMPASVLLEVLASQVTSKLHYDRIIQEIEKINANDSTYQTYLDAKAIFHVLPVHGNYQITYHKADNSPYISKVTAEGHWGSFTTPMALKMIDAFMDNKVEQKGGIRTAFEFVENIYEKAALYSKESAIFEHAQEAYDRYQKGETILLPTGWEGHFVNVILDPSHDYFIVANCGMRFHGLPGGASIYKMHNPEGLSPNLIYSILNNLDQMDLELVFKYHLALDKVENLSQPDQIHGNCAWQSHEPAIEALLYISFLNQGYAKAEAKSVAHQQYLSWDAYQTFTQMENYFENDPALSIQSLKDMLFENHTSLFTSKNPKADFGVNATEYEQARYIVSVLTKECYKKEVASVFSEVLKKAKPELLNLFKSAGFSIKMSDKLDISDIIFNGSDENIFENEEVIELDSLFKHDFSPIFPGIEFVLKKEAYLGFDASHLNDWC